MTAIIVSADNNSNEWVLKILPAILGWPEELNRLGRSPWDPNSPVHCVILSREERNGRDGGQAGS